MKNSKIKIVLILSYVVFAILLNSVGTVILQVQYNFGVDKADASVLEGFKDIPIAISAFLLASFLPRIGIKKSMLFIIAAVTIFCFIMPYANAFWAFKLLFAAVGVSFGLIKTSIYTSVRLVTDTAKEHSSFMGVLEGFFMVGVLAGNVLFSLFIDDSDPTSLSWTNVYWVLGCISLLSFVLLSFSQLNEEGAHLDNRPLKDDVKFSLKLLNYRKVGLFIVCAFLYVLIEQSFQTWTPTFYKDVLDLPTSMAVQAGAVLAGAYAVGRFLSGYFSLKFKWIYVVGFCIIAFGISVFLVLPLTNNFESSKEITWLNAPLVVYLFPLMGVFLSPIYPSINSVILASIPKFMQSSMSGLIVIFSAVGGTTGSLLAGHLFDRFSGQQAFYITAIVPLILLFLAVITMNKTKLYFKLNTNA